MHGLPWILLALLIVVGAPAAWWWHRRSAAPATARAAGRGTEALDTVADWPPTATRLLTAAEREAHQALLAALPDCLVFAQVPLTRFLRVPTRHSYGDWVARVGQLSVDLLICDPGTAVLAALEIRPAQQSGRALLRHQRMLRVLQAAGVRVVVWQEGQVPAPPQAIRSALLPQEMARKDIGSSRPAPQRSTMPPMPPSSLTRIPAGETPGPGTGPADAPPDPPPTTWYSDLDEPPAAPASRPGSGRR